MRYFYIDTENVKAQDWCYTLHRLEATDVVYLFISDKSCQMPIDTFSDIQECKAKVEIISVTNGVQNGMDFVIVAKLSRQSVTATKSQHFILSKDNGFDAAILYLSKLQVKVSRKDTLSAALKSV